MKTFKRILSIFFVYLIIVFFQNCSSGFTPLNLSNSLDSFTSESSTATTPDAGTSGSSCTFNSTTVPNGSSVTAYLAANVAVGQSCTSEVRTCTNGILSGSYGFDACIAAQPLPPNGKLPGWVNSLSLWQWYEIPNTALSSVSPNPQPCGSTGPQSKIIAWNGATLKREGSVYMLGAAGGHGDYCGNEVDALTLNTDTPQWIQLSSPSDDSLGINESQFFLDKKPSPTHTFYGTQFINARNRMFILNSPGMLFSGLPNAPSGWPYAGYNGYSFSFNLTTNTWDIPEYIATFTGGGDYTAALVAKHPVTEDIYYSPYGAGWWKWTQTTNTWLKLSDIDDGNYAGAAIDPIRDRMLVVGNYGGTYDPRVRNLDGTVVPVNFGGLGAIALHLGSYPGVIYDEANNKFLIFANGETGIVVYRVDPVTWFVDMPATTGVSPESRINGIHNSVQYVPELHGIVIANSYRGNVYFMRTAP